MEACDKPRWAVKTQITFLRLITDSPPLPPSHTVIATQKPQPPLGCEIQLEGGPPPPQHTQPTPPGIALTAVLIQVYIPHMFRCTAALPSRVKLQPYFLYSAVTINQIRSGISTAVSWRHLHTFKSQSKWAESAKIQQQKKTLRGVSAAAECAATLQCWRWCNL